MVDQQAGASNADGLDAAAHDDGHMDLSDHDSFTGGIPHRTFERLRAEDPVHWTPEHDGGANHLPGVEGFLKP